MRNRSIRFKLTLWFTLIITALVGITFAAVMLASRSVLRSTIRQYLISTVEENIDNIRLQSERGDTDANLYIPCGTGFLEINLDFMETVNDVHTALYTSGGEMLYGENPISRFTVNEPFVSTRIRSVKAGGVKYEIYDRKLDIDYNGDSLWIRGVVPETRSETQLREITRTSLFMLPVLIGLAVLSGYLLSDRMLAPIRKIEETAESISKGDDLKKRIPTGKNNDEVNRLAAGFNNMFDRLENAFEKERQFTSDASHELRTPVSVILAQSEYTLEKERSAEEYREALGTVREQADRMRMLIGDMLDYTRIDQHSERYSFERVDLSALVNEACSDMKLLAGERMTFTWETEPGVETEGNALLLRRLVQNLVSNAFRYGYEDGTTKVSLSAEGGHPVISVADNGPGIDAADQEKIFDRFYRGDRSRTEQGTGLGLSMVKKIADLHGARIVLKSAPGEGSEFRIVFR